MSHSPFPWRWSTTAFHEYNMGGIVAADGTVVCHFGDDTQYYPSEGQPPNADDLGVILAHAEDTHAFEKLVTYAQEHWPMETGRNVADVFIERAGKMHAALTRLLAKETSRWEEQGYGRATCTSCGAQREIEYGDHETPPKETREACSRSCPWRLAEEAIDAKPNLIQDAVKS